MKLMTKEIREKIKPLMYYEKHNTEDIPIAVKFFTPDSNWTWYAYEFDGEDEFFGLVDGFEMEFGSFSLKELESVRGALGLPIERDLHFGKVMVQEILDKKER